MSGGPPVFVVGVGRSGTSLVQSMLASHPALAFPPETAFARRFVMRGTLRRLARTAGAEGVIARLEADGRFGRLCLSARELVDRVARDGPLTDAALYRHLLYRWARDHGASRPGDKDPRLVEHLDPLGRVFPDAWVVHVIRDPRDVLNSKKRAAWSSGGGVLRHVFANRVQLELGRRRGSRRFGPRYVEIRYEALLAEPAGTLRALCAALDLDYDPAMLNYHGTARHLVSPSEEAWKAETLGPLLTDNTEKWRTGLSPWELALVECACREAIEIGGQSPSGATADLGVAARLGARFACGLLRAVDPVYVAARRLRNAAVRI